MSAIYIKPMTWAGRTKFYLGLKPSDPTAEPSYRLGGYFLACQTIESARAVAVHEARRIGAAVVECPHYVGL